MQKNEKNTYIILGLLAAAIAYLFGNKKAAPASSGSVSSRFSGGYAGSPVIVSAPETYRPVYSRSVPVIDTPSVPAASGVPVVSSPVASVAPPPVVGGGSSAPLSGGGTVVSSPVSGSPAPAPSSGVPSPAAGGVLPSGLGVGIAGISADSSPVSFSPSF